MELTHLGTLKTILSEVLLLSREQRRLRQSLSDGLGRMGALPENAVSPPISAAPSVVASSPVYREGRNLDEAAMGGKDPRAAAPAREEAEALRTAMDGLAREVAGLQAAIKGLRWAQASVQAKANVSSRERSGTPPVIIADDSNRSSPRPITNHAASSGSLTSIYRRNRASGRRAPTGGVILIERSASDSTPSAAASTSANVQFTSVVLVGRQSAAEPSSKQLLALPFSHEAAAHPAPNLCSSPLSPAGMPELQLTARGVDAARHHHHHHPQQQQQQQQQQQPPPPQQQQQQHLPNQLQQQQQGQEQQQQQQQQQCPPTPQQHLPKHQQQQQQQQQPQYPESSGGWGIPVTSAGRPLFDAGPAR
jgi:hypothetical protein